MNIQGRRGKIRPMKDKISALRRTAVFGELDDKTLGALAAPAVARRLSRGEVLFVAGEEARGLYVVVAGALRASRVSPDGREQVVHVERAPATIAEVPVFDEGPYPSTVAAEQETAVLFLDRTLARLQQDRLIRADGRRLVRDDEAALAGHAGEVR